MAVASSSNRPIIDLVLELGGLDHLFRVTVSSEEVQHGKPSPEIYLEAALRLGVDTQRTVAVEDSHSGILAARAAGMRVIAIPNRRYPPGEGALAKADAMLEDVSELTPEAVEGTG